MLFRSKIVFISEFSTLNFATVIKRNIYLLHMSEVYVTNWTDKKFLDSCP